MDDGALCTLDELTELVGTALSVDYPGAPTGRVRDVPDQRVIRWYVTRGLVDRPVAARGRVALYGRRHLLQLVAIKRRQAEGASLAEIQAELTGATDEALARVARLAELPTRPRDGHGTAAPLPQRTRFWADRPAPAAAAAPVEPAVDATVLRGIRLAPGVTLLIEDGAARATDLAAIQAAARPLLDLLATGAQARSGAGGPHDSSGAGGPHDTDEEKP